MDELNKLNGNEYFEIAYFKEIVNNYLFTINKNGDKHSFKLNENLLNKFKLAEIKKGQLLGIRSMFDSENVEFIATRISFLKSN